jgi:hypothetical protein
MMGFGQVLGRRHNKHNDWAPGKEQQVADFFFFEAIVNGIISIYSFLVCSLLVYRKANDFCKLILYPATLL